MATDPEIEDRKLALEELKERNARDLRERELEIEAQKAAIGDTNLKADTRGRSNVALISVLSALIGAAASMGAAFLTGNLNLQERQIESEAVASLEQQKFSYELISTALNEEDDSTRAQRLRFMVDIGLLNNLNVDKLIEYAALEVQRIESGVETPSLIPKTPETFTPARVDRAIIKPGYAIRLIEVGPTKINLIKEIRAATGLGLKESKDISEAPGDFIISGLAEEAARELAAKFTTAGARVDVELVEFTK